MNDFRVVTLVKFLTLSPMMRDMGLPIPQALSRNFTDVTFLRKRIGKTYLRKYGDVDHVSGDVCKGSS